MRKDAPNTGVFVNRTLVRKVKSLAAGRGWRLGEVVDAFVGRLLDQVERGDRLSLAVPEYKKETRKDTAMVLVNKNVQRRVRILAAQRDITARSFVRLAVDEGLEIESRQPGTVIPSRAKENTDTKAVALRAPLVDQLKTLAASRGLSVVSLTEAVMRTVVDQPVILDSIELPMTRDITPSAAVNAAARRAVELATPPGRRSIQGPGVRRRTVGTKRRPVKHT